MNSKFCFQSAIVCCLVSLMTVDAGAQFLRCKPAVDETTLNQVAGKLCASQWNEIEIASSNLNADGTRSDEDLDRFNTLLNDLEAIDGKVPANKAEELATILKKKSQLRISIQKNLLLTKFGEAQLDTWCRWRKTKDNSDYGAKLLKDIRRVEEFFACGVEK